VPARQEGLTTLSRRRLLLGAAALALGACGTRRAVADPAVEERGRAVLRGRVTVDIHSHAGRIITSRLPFEPVAAPMREGGMAAICLAMVADSPVTRIAPDGRIEAVRAPASGELYGWSRTAFARLGELVEREGLQIVTDAAALRAAPERGPSVIVAAEGADFLDFALERVAEAHERYRLRHLQLTHYRANTLGDIQTEPPVHGGLSDFGAAVIRECNRLGIVVDVAHGPYDLVKRAVDVTTKPLVLSHTSLSPRPGPRSRQVGHPHARLIAETGGVIGIWPNKAIYPDLATYAAGIARMAEAVGVDHVGIGTDMRGLTLGSVFDDYRELPRLAAALLDAGFGAEDVAKLLGGNYARVFAACVG
jgi:membrane dipeptidase